MTRALVARAPTRIDFGGGWTDVPPYTEREGGAVCNVAITRYATATVATGLEEKLLPDYPEWALRELLMNAVMHRNYDSNTPIRFYAFSGHVEIHSPGGLYGEATPENFPRRSSYRNPVIAEAMKSLGFVNRFGYGVQRAQALLSQNGNPPAEFTFDSHSVLVTIKKRAQ